MDISDPVEAVDDPSDPENVTLTDSASSISLSSVDSEDGNGVDIACDIIPKFDQDIGPWLFQVLTVALRNETEEIGSVRAYLIKRERIEARDNKKKSLRKAMKDEDDMLNVMFELPTMFHPHGHVNADFLQPSGYCFRANDMRAFSLSNDATDHPVNRAWILLIRDVVVKTEYRRLGIGSSMIRKTLQAVTDECVVASRPLLVAVQPKRTDEYSDEEWSQIGEMVYHCRVNEVFWENIGFKRWKSSFTGFTAPWYFWGTAFSMPPKKRVTIPNGVEFRNTRTATPPPAPQSPRTFTRPTPYDLFPVVDGTTVISFYKPSNRVLPTILPAPLRNDSPLGNGAGDNVRWFDNPDDPSVTPDEAEVIRNLMRTLDAVGKKYQVRPIKEPVQTSGVQPVYCQSNCPFKAPPRAIAPRPLALSYTLPPKPPSPQKFQRTPAPERTPLPSAPQNGRDQASSTEPGSRFLVTSEDEGDSDSDGWIADDLETYSYEDLVACGYIDGDEDDEDDDV